MRWEGERESENVEDERGSGGGGMFGSGGFGGNLPGGPMVFHGGLGSLVVIVILCAVFGVNPMQLLQQAPQGNPGRRSFNGRGIQPRWWRSGIQSRRRLPRRRAGGRCR